MHLINLQSWRRANKLQSVTSWLKLTVTLKSPVVLSQMGTHKDSIPFSLIVRKFPKRITPGRKRPIKKLLFEFQDIFTKPRLILDGPVYLNMKQTQAIAEKYASLLDESRLQNVKKEEMKNMGVIEPSQSSWSSPIVLVKKKDESIRFCIDQRRLNDVTIKDSHNLYICKRTPRNIDPGTKTRIIKLNLKDKVQGMVFGNINL